MQSVTIKIRFFPSNSIELKLLSREYIRAINSLTEQAEKEGSFPKLTTKDVEAKLPSAVLNQAIRDAKSVFKKTKKEMKRPILKKPTYYINNQNYSIGHSSIAFPIIVDNKVKKTIFPALLTERDKKFLQNAKCGLMRIVEKSGKWFAQVSLEIPTETTTGEQAIGIDLGLKVPAVAVTSEGKTRFFGNGRENKYMKRKFRSERKGLGKKKKLRAIRKLDHKEQRWMKDKDHKVSRQIVNFAMENQVSVIRLEKLTNIRKTTRTSRKNEKNLHTWSFNRLAQFIEYKANMAGIKVEYVNPAYTSQKCPSCSTLNKAIDRKYSCLCGFHTHRDKVGAMNIIHAPVIGGNSQSA
ncbi:RNA-guided endonuclease InsQ/TnpB family protein [Paenibacillus donghaensis]|uniref:Transposase n=1 Tax=Paenibacillus donghaensis TaxID=414771 RepID=A0A2Z2KN33_9BACL|nr:RNA-guided endonuclease TnpB family protein [Paenibacillus donghaensis]ASA20138.1 transposase [Paenibacillus donghaensis]